jgi:crossover junction endodeoxyribonuclease RusA
MIILTLPYPISANRYWASRIMTPKGTKRPMSMTYVTPEARDYKADVALRAKLAGVRTPILGRVAVEIKLFPHRPLDYKKRMRDLGDAWDDTVMCIDLGNCEKVLNDSLKDVVFGDDKWLHDIHLIRMEPDDGDARVIVTVRPYVRTANLQQDLLGAAA